MMENTALAVANNTYLPVMNIEVALARREQVRAFVGNILIKGTDFGVIPGTGDQKSLLKPGAEKLATFFGLTPILTTVDRVEDWTGVDHDGEPFLHYRCRGELYRDGVLMASAEASCNSWETKYRWRRAERVCPDCGQAAIIKTNSPRYGEKWWCSTNKGGCKNNFALDDKRIVEQQTGRIPNPEIADIANTILKMAEKRALVAVVLLATNASDLFDSPAAKKTTDQSTPMPEPPPDPIEGEYRTLDAKPGKDAAQPAAQAKNGHKAKPTPAPRPPDPTPDPTPDRAVTEFLDRIVAALDDDHAAKIPWALRLHRDSDGPCSAEELGKLVALIEDETSKASAYLILSVLCQTQISDTNPPGKNLALKMIAYLDTTQASEHRPIFLSLVHAIHDAAQKTIAEAAAQ